jgi:hypothetical protein
MPFSNKIIKRVSRGLSIDNLRYGFNCHEAPEISAS